MAEVTADEVMQRLCGGETMLVLDIRPVEAFQTWHITACGLTVVNIPWSVLRQSELDAYPELPRDRPIIVVCAKGISAVSATEFLANAGYHAVTMVGGMQAWSQVYRTDQVAQTVHYDIWQVCRPAKGCLSYFVQMGDEALVVDPGRHLDVYIQLAHRHGARIRMIVDTHLHADHVSGASQLRKITGAEYHLSENDPLRSGLLPIARGMVSIEKIPTPGHTPGSCSLLIDGQYLLSGDTVFVRGVGRPDLHGEAVSYGRQLYHTVQALRAKLPDDVWILPAHYGSEEERNEFRFIGAMWSDLKHCSPLITVNDEAEFVTQVSQQVGTTPPNYGRVLSINRGELQLSPAELTDLEIGPNRCAVT